MSPTHPPAITAQGLTKRYNGFLTAVQDVSFTVPTGTSTALVGPPGSGKTTVLRILLGLMEPTVGSATVAGTNPVRAGRSATAGAAPTRVGAVLSPRGLHPRRTVRDHLRVCAAAAGLPDSRVRAVLELTGLAERSRAEAGALSPGEETRAALATALLTDPPLLLLDDPLPEQDTDETTWLQEFLRAHIRRGGTALFTARRLAPVLPAADGLVVLGEGTVVYRGSPARLRRGNPDRLVVASSSPIALATMLASRGLTDAVIRPDGRLAVAGATETEIVAAAHAAAVRLDGIVADPIHPDRVLASLTKPTARPAPAPGYRMPQPSTPMPHGVPR
ncbi:ATP-binding cassette domain-containing protein [Nocardia paucivorans]|uniref:ATP-binding cassette domain-containing protein n=1 Tax=Nocardia paucivorans TaxID=114259 RepID=UPI00031B8581|nr:ATP-binding cassette domain-containing protein [Nocardia paucivorans]